MPKVSEIAKDLGYKAAELVDLLKALNVGVTLASARVDVDARTAAIITAKLPPRRSLKGPQLEAYQQIVQQHEAEAAAPKAPRKEKAEKKPKEPKEAREPREAKVEPPAKAPAAAPAPAPAAAAPVVHAASVHVVSKEKPKAEKEKDKKPKEVVLVSTRDAAATDKPKAAPAAGKVGLTAEEKAAIKQEVEKPLIDVDKVIGEEHQVLVLRAAEAQAIDKGTVTTEADKLHRAVAAKPKPAPVVRPARPGARPMPVRRPQAPAQPRPAITPPQPPKPKPVVIPIEQRKFEITVPIKLKDFSALTGIKTDLIQKHFMAQGGMVPITASLSEDQVTELAVEFNRNIEVKKEKAAEDVASAETAQKDDPKDLVSRAPVVVVMGHVDHGKTSLLDRIRGTAVAAGEAGGITQHIGAYRISTKEGKPVVFLDTPGHAAFTEMRARGANVTDVAVIVVAADDGVMAQTVEAINHAKAAGVKIVVALNKIDKPQANPNKVKGELSAQGLQPEDWGGKTVCCEVSAITGQGVDHLVEMLSLEAELLDLKANPRRKAQGTVLEARKTDDRGPVATVLVQTGTLRRGDVILAGSAYGRVRAMRDDRGRTVTEAGPATPVEVQGLDGVPDAGARLLAVDSIDIARSIAEERQRKVHEASLSGRQQQLTLEGLFQQIESGKLKELPVIVKVDVKGSLEVFRKSLADLSHKEVKLTVLHAEVGAVNESDVTLAAASNAIIVGFHVDVEERARQLAKDKGVEVKIYTVIYEAIEELKAALEGLLEPEIVEVKSGRATVKEVFRISRVGAVAGCIVTEGKIERSAEVRQVRDGKVIHTGKLESLKRFKDDVKEVQSGYECGIKLAGRDDIVAGDILEAFQVQKRARKLG